MSQGLGVIGFVAVAGEVRGVWQEGHGTGKYRPGFISQLCLCHVVHVGLGEIIQHHSGSIFCKMRLYLPRRPYRVVERLNQENVSEVRF